MNAGGSALVLIGTLDNGASVAAAVHQAGSASVPLESAIRLLTTYPKGATVVIRSEPGKVWFDKLSFNLK